jgi:hypothetical protein
MLDQLGKFFRNLVFGDGPVPQSRQEQLLAVGRAALHLLLWPWRWLTRPRPRRWPILRPYVNPRHPARMIARVAFPIGLAVACLIYGFLFGLTAPFLLLPFAVPIVILVALAIWALPEQKSAPTMTMEIFFAGVLISLLVWPVYLAIAIPGLPWITLIRLTSFPMTFLFLISLSTSSRFRHELGSVLFSIRPLWICLAIFVSVQFLTLPLAKRVGEAVEAAIISQINWTTMLLVAMWVGSKPGRAELYTKLIVMLAAPMIIIALFETKTDAVLWINNVPSFLKIDDELAAQYMSTGVRHNMNRVKAIYSNPLTFAEYLALTTPFLIHMAIQKYNIVARVAAVVMIPLFFHCVQMTDARLGNVGMLVSFLSYFLLWGLLQLRKNVRSLLAAAVVYAYPAMFAVVLVAVMTIHRLHVLVFGAAYVESSNAAREAQIRRGLPQILAQPWGHGANSAGEAVSARGAFVTIDNYYLTLGLDYGVLGVGLFAAMFIMAMIVGTRGLLEDPRRINDREKTLLLPLICSMAVFLVIKSVLSQIDNHALAFTLLGLLLGLGYRVAQTPVPPLPSRVDTKRAPPRKAHVGQRAPVLARQAGPRPSAPSRPMA